MLCWNRHEIRSYAGPVDWSLRHYGPFGYAQLFLSKLYVLVSAVDGHRCFVPLALHAIVSSNIRSGWYLWIVLHAYLIFYRSTLQGKTSHKFIDPSENQIMRLYYQKDILTFMCCGNELFYSALYLLNFTSGPTSKYKSFITELLSP